MPITALTYYFAPFSPSFCFHFFKISKCNHFNLVFQSFAFCLLFASSSFFILLLPSEFNLFQQRHESGSLSLFIWVKITRSMVTLSCKFQGSFHYFLASYNFQVYQSYHFFSSGRSVIGIPIQFHIRVYTYKLLRLFATTVLMQKIYQFWKTINY